MSSGDREGRTDLHYAALQDDETRARALLSSGFDVNAPDRLGFTPLHLAAQEMALTVAALLLENGAEVDPINSFGNTPLFTAVFNSRGRGEMINLLRRAGADPLRQNNHEQSPVGLARLIGNYDIAQFFTDVP
jgi:ankyrin repeat protein